MEISTIIYPASGLPPCLAPASSAQPAESSLTEKEAAPEGEFAVLLALLRMPSADKAAGETCAAIAGQLVPAGLQLMVQPADTPDAGGEAGNLPASLPVRWPGSGNTPAGHYEIACLPGSPAAGLMPSLPAEGKASAASDAPVGSEPVPATQNARDDVMKTVPLPGEVTAAGKERDGLTGVFEQQLQAGGEKAEQGVAKMTPAAVQPSPGISAKGKLTGGPEQDKIEAKPVEGSTQPSVRPVLTPAEPVQTEAVRRLQDVKSAVLEQVLEKMVFSRSETGEAKVTVRLKPPALGEVEISLYLEDGRLSGRIVAENAMVRELLDAALTQLRQRLEAQQLQVAELTVSIGQEKEYHRGRDSHEGAARHPGGREKAGESASPLAVVLPGLLNALA
jgi:hypothetical protein